MAKDIPIGVPTLNQPAAEEAGFFSRMVQKIKKDPAVFVGMAGWTGLVGYGIYNVKKRKTTLPLYLIHLRVTAQVFAIGCMVSVVGYRIFVHERNKYSQKDDSKE